MDTEYPLLQPALEAMLFAAAKPLSVRQLVQASEAPETTVRSVLEKMMQEWNQETRGMHIIEHEGTYRFATNPQVSAFVEKITKSEAGDLTRPALETLTVIAYRGPITQPEIEAIRGVQCTLILRNLLMRGLITERDNKERGSVVYTLSVDALRFLGVHSEKELPDFEAFHGDERLTKIIDALPGV